MIIGKGKITIKKSGNGGYKSVWIYVPSKIAKDINFPFTENEEVIIELEEGKVIINKANKYLDKIKKFGSQNVTLSKLLEIKADSNEESAFLYYKECTYTYKQLDEFSTTLAYNLINTSNHLELKSMKVAVMLPNCPEFIFSWFGITKANSVFIPIDSLLTEELLFHELTVSEPDILLIEYKYLEHFKNVINKYSKLRKIFIRNAPNYFYYTQKNLKFQDLMNQKVERPKFDIRKSDPIEIHFTQGTTGKPKAVICTNVTIAGISIGCDLIDIGFSRGSKIICPVPLNSGCSRFLAVIPALFYNASIILIDEEDFSNFWPIVQKYKPDGFCYLGEMLHKLILKCPIVEEENHSLKWAVGFGAFEDIWKCFEDRFNISLYECWSQGEGVGITINKLGSKGGKFGSVGKPIDLIELKIIDSDGNELPPGIDNIGEILVKLKSFNSFKCYKTLERMVPIITEDGWFHTRDYGYLDEDGYLYFKGKAQDLYKKEECLFFARDIERIVNRHPCIKECAVINVQEKYLNNNSLKLIIVKVKNKSIEYQDIIEFLHQNLSYFMIPKYYEFKDRLPRNSGSEILKFNLKTEANNGEINIINWKNEIYNIIT